MRNLIIRELEKVSGGDCRVVGQPCVTNGSGSSWVESGDYQESDFVYASAGADGSDVSSDVYLWGSLL